MFMNKLQFNKLVKKGYNHIPVSRELIIDTYTPLAIYLKCSSGKYNYFLESVQGGERWSRYSFIGLEASKIIKVFDYKIILENNKGEIIQEEQVLDPLCWIEEYKSQFKVPKLDDIPTFNGGLVGYFGYEIIRYIEPKLKNISKNNELGTPDILLMLSNDLIVCDNLSNKFHLITHINPQKNSFEDAIARLDEIELNIHKPLPEKSKKSQNINVNNFVSSFSKEKFISSVDKIRKYIIAGDVMQVVPSRRLSCDFNAEPIEFYRQLRILNPSPYMYFLNLDDFFIIGSSPEILTRVENNNIATVRPMAGTRPRGNNKQKDLDLELELLADEKEIAEHLMLIDLGRNDIGKIAKTGTVKVTEKMFVERYSHVMHIVSNIECQIKDSFSAIDVLRATFPAGTLSGAPKLRAMEIINEIEPFKRNIYSGAIGNLSWHGDMDMAIAIRTAVIKDKKIYIQAGAGIVYDSKPESEWQETIDKAQALIKACEKI